jgi:hypothetical protein
MMCKTLAARVVAVASAASLIGCSRPFDLNDARLHVAVDGATCGGLGSVSVFVDGTLIGSVRPGENGIETDVKIGQHAVSALGWTPQIVTVPANGFFYTFSCLPNGQPLSAPPPSA